MAFEFKFEGAITDLTPGSPPWIRARCHFLRRMMNDDKATMETILKTLEDLRAHEAWLKYPEGHPWGSVDAMLLDVVGYTLRDLQLEFERRTAPLAVAALPPAADPHSRPGNDGGSRGLARSADEYLASDDTSAACADIPRSHGHSEKRNNQTAEGHIARLKREAARGDEQAAELLAKVEAGDLAPTRAAVIAGFRKPPNPATQAVNLVRRIDDPEALDRISAAIAKRHAELDGRNCG